MNLSRHRTVLRLGKEGVPSKTGEGSSRCQAPIKLHRSTYCALGPQVAEQNASATCDATFGSDAYGAIHVAFRAGMNPAGIRAISFIDLISTAETLLVCSLAT